jgi:ABC-type multidrug transport system permease subunit
MKYLKDLEAAIALVMVVLIMILFFMMVFPLR